MLYSSINWDTVDHVRFEKRLSHETLELLKEQVYRIMRDQQKDELFNEFIQWTPEKNEIAIYADYSLVEFSLPKRFDRLAKRDEFREEIEAELTIPYSIINGWTAINKIVKGHKHVCIMQFSGDIPRIIKELPEVNQMITVAPELLTIYKKSDLFSQEVCA